MSHLTVQLIKSDLRSAPARSIAVALLLTAAGILPSLLSASPTAGAVLAFTVAFAATAGALAAHERRTDVLELNGASVRTESIVAAASMVVPGIAAAIAALAVGTLLDPSPSSVSVIVSVIVVPVLASTSGGVGRAPRPCSRFDRLDAKPQRHGLRRGLGVVALVLLCLAAAVLSPALPLAVLAIYLTTRSPRSLAMRIGGLVLAVAILVAVTVVAGRSSTWLDLSGVLLWLGPGAIVAVAVIGRSLLDATGAAIATIGPRARIAITPLTRRGRSLGPIVGILAVVTSLAALEGTVGASFGQREEERDRTVPAVSAPAGTSADQAIATVPPVDIAELGQLISEATAGTSTRAVVIEQLGVGGAEPPASLFSGLLGESAVLLADDPDSQGPRWIGAVDAADLPLLGLQDSAADLEAGRVVVLDPGLDLTGGKVTIISPEGTTERDAALAPGAAEAALLPGALMSPAASQQVTDTLLPARVVVVPEPGQAVESDTLLAVASTISARAASLPISEPPGLSAAESQAFQIQRTIASSSSSAGVSLGNEEVVLFGSGPLNDVPMLAQTRDDGRNRLFAFGALAALMTVAAVVLATGATRAEDAVLHVQGAPDLLRSTVGSLQAAVLAGTAAAVAAVIGIGVPALAFRLYNGARGAARHPARRPGRGAGAAPRVAADVCRHHRDLPAAAPRPGRRPGLAVTAISTSVLWQHSRPGAGSRAKERGQAAWRW